jgi:hypothetical protein
LTVVTVQDDESIQRIELLDHRHLHDGLAPSVMVLCADIVNVTMHIITTTAMFRPTLIITAAVSAAVIATRAPVFLAQQCWNDQRI